MKDLCYDFLNQSKDEIILYNKVSPRKPITTKPLIDARGSSMVFSENKKLGLI